jgi:hypothetical protein
MLLDWTRFSLDDKCVGDEAVSYGLWRKFSLAVLKQDTTNWYPIFLSPPFLSKFVCNFGSCKQKLRSMTYTRAQTDLQISLETLEVFYLFIAVLGFH